MPRHAGMGKRATRSPRTRSTPKEEDEQTELEIGMASSGRSKARPQDRLYGPYRSRFEPESSARGRDAAVTTMPPSRGAQAAPTKLAAKRERERHRLERDLGQTAAGEKGDLRGRQGPGVSRAALRGAQKQADRNVIGRELPSRSK